MKLGLEGRAALVTGGSRGIGAAIVRALKAEGCRVAIVHLDDEERAAAVGADLAIHSDVADFDEAQVVVARVLGELGRLDALVCCAGITRDRVSWKMSEAEWDSVLDVNLKGCFNYCRAAVPAFREAKHGRIVAITSINGLRGKFGQANYAASKGGLVALVKTLAKELGAFGVTVNAIAPGMIETEMTKDVPEKFLDEARRESVLGRLGEPQDVADLVAFLCSDRARHITGECLRVDGGQAI